MKSLAHDQAQSILSAILANRSVVILAYDPVADVLYRYGTDLSIAEEIPRYRAHLTSKSPIHPDDRQKLRELYLQSEAGQTEVRLVMDGTVTRWNVQTLATNEAGESRRRTFIARDITREKNRERELEEQATRDPLTLLYNYAHGRELVNEYLETKDPYTTCGMIVLDIDYFKYVNDTFGHLFGDQVLCALADLLRGLFGEDDIVMRFGGDEFTVLIKDIGHADLMQKGMELIEACRTLSFEGKDYTLTCSAGICFLPENESGYTFDELFGNADWALYRAKENGRNQYVFCDHLRRFEQSVGDLPAVGGIEARYLLNDIISTAFEVFDKSSSFPLAINQLLEIIGRRFRLDRITVIRTDIQAQQTGRQYQWTSDYAPEVLSTDASYTREDFVTLFNSYDEYQTCVLQADDMGAYSPGGAALLMQGGAKTVLYAAMYCEGKYTGAISYVTCRERRYWSRQNRRELGEVTKIISAHLARTLAVGQDETHLIMSEYDPLTGLTSFSQFRVELERLVIGGHAQDGYLLYMDFAGFKFFNQRYGYSEGDQLLKEFSNFVASSFGREEGALFARVVSDQFLLFLPHGGHEDITQELERLCRDFIETEALRRKGARLRMRVGIYQIEPDCVGASYAIDAANYARMQVSGKPGSTSGTVRVFDEALRERRRLENTVYNELGEALNDENFVVYLQPKVSLRTGEVTGAEALARWQTRDGVVLTPDHFIPICESSEMIKELDYYIFERVAAFIAKNERLGRRQVPISVNASILHAMDDRAAERYRAILERYGIDARYTEIELTETATIQEYEEARRLFGRLRQMGIRTAIDDFGAGYSVLNSIIDIPVETMKLDRGFIKNCTSSAREINFLNKIVQMIQALGYRVACEGIETEEQARILRDAGCDEAQGYLYSQPLPIEQYEQLVYPADA